MIMLLWMVEGNLNGFNLNVSRLFFFSPALCKNLKVNFSHHGNERAPGLGGSFACLWLMNEWKKKLSLRCSNAPRQFSSLLKKIASLKFLHRSWKVFHFFILKFSLFLWLFSFLKRERNFDVVSNLGYWERKGSEEDARSRAMIW